MPHTLAHPAAVLPLLGRARLPGTALVVGSVAPDLAYFVPLGVTRAQSHSPAGMLWFCLPAGLLAYAVFHLVVSQLAVELAPRGLAARLPVHWARGAPPRASLARVASALLLGTLSHVAWDAFTHAGDPGVRAFPWLTQPLFELRGHPVRVFKLLQHGGTLLGAAAIALVFLRWWRRTPPRAASPDASAPTPRSLTPAQRVGLTALLLLPSTALVARAAWTASVERAGPLRTFDHVATTASFDGGAAFLGMLLVVACARSVLRDPRPGDPP